VGIREYLEIIGGVLVIIAFISPIICTLIKGRLMPSVQKHISDSIKESATILRKDFKYDLKNQEDNIISIARNIVKDEIKENEESGEEKRLLRSATWNEKLDNLKSMVKKNETQRAKETEIIFEVLDSIKTEINSLSKLSVSQQGLINENKSRLDKIERDN
jgi:hypothetical protein